MLHDAVEKITVRDPQPFAVGEGMDGIFLDLNVAEVQPDKLSNALVVIAGDENDTCPFATFAQDFLNNVVVGLWPVPAFF